MDHLKADLARRARDLGFVRMGVAAAEPLSKEGDRLDLWLQQGRHGEMAYMERTAAVRRDVKHPGMLPSARSVVVLAAPYDRQSVPSAHSPTPGRIARYALGGDYHNTLSKRAKALAAQLRAAGHQARAGVDRLPIFERAWAQRAGLGFIGKNACLIIPGVGSHVFLAAVVTSAELEPDPPMAERCGACTRCLDGCPTDAFAGPWELDGRECISYLTIELRAPIPERYRAQMGDRLFGCDECQDVCPFNHGKDPDLTIGRFAPDPRWAEMDAAEFLEGDEDAHIRRTQGTPLRRPGREGLARNAAIVLGNVGGKRHLPVLRRVAEQDPSAMVRGSAEWALRRLQSRGLL